MNTHRMIRRLAFFFLAVLSPTLIQAAAEEPLYTQKGTDPTFAEVLASGKIPKGTPSKVGVIGSIIKVNKSRVEVGPNASNSIPADIGLHTLPSSGIKRKDFPKWSRWYQEDGHVQIFRLFKDEINVHNTRPLSARVETYSHLRWQQGDWHEWSGTYTIIKPHKLAIFQAKNGGEPNWAVQLNMDNEGNVFFCPRRQPPKLITKNMTGKPFHIRLRDNGHDFEVYLDGEKAGTGSWDRPTGETNFRWGMYVGEHPIEHDAMIFVTGATFK